MTILSKRGLLGSKGTSNCKQKIVSFFVAKHRTKSILDYVHSDLRGPSRVPLFRGKHYMLTFVDDFSHKI